jgi:hypothetical protein
MGIADVGLLPEEVGNGNQFRANAKGLGLGSKVSIIRNKSIWRYDTIIKNVTVSESRNEVQYSFETIDSWNGSN